MIIYAVFYLPRFLVFEYYFNISDRYLFLSAFFGKKTGKLRFATAQRTDKRILLVNQILSGIEVVKMFAWEKFVGKQVQTARE